MGDNSNPAPQPEAIPQPEPTTPEAAANEQAIDEEVGDFISGHVLEKDSVFFEG